MPSAGWHHWRRYWRARPASPLELFANRNGKNIAHAAHCLPSTTWWYTFFVDAYLRENFWGSTTMLIVPLTSIKQQILVDCGKRGISVLDGDQVLPVLNITHFSTIIELVESSFHSSLHPTWRESFWSSQYCSLFLASNKVTLLAKQKLHGGCQGEGCSYELPKCQLAPVGS